MATATTTIEKREYTLLERAVYAPNFRTALATVLGSDTAADCFIVEIFNQARQIPALHRCTIDSIRFHLLRIAALQLNPALPNEVSLIPRNLKQPKERPQDRDTYALELTIIYGYAGLRKLVMRSPEVKDCFTKEVCVNDAYEPADTPTALPRHQLPGQFAPRGRVIGYYAAIQMHSGNWRVWPMSVAEVEGHAARYAREAGPAWNKGKRPDVEDGLTPFDKMGLKTCLRMALNGRDIPLTAEVQEVLAREVVETMPETAAQAQGYDRQGHRPALPMSTGGVTLETLTQELYGSADKEVLEAEHAHVVRATEKPRARQPQQSTVKPLAPSEEETSPAMLLSTPVAPAPVLEAATRLKEGLAWDTLRAYLTKDVGVPADLLARVAALCASPTATDSEAHALADTVLQWAEAFGRGASPRQEGVQPPGQ